MTPPTPSSASSSPGGSTDSHSPTMQAMPPLTSFHSNTMHHHRSYPASPYPMLPSTGGLHHHHHHQNTPVNHHHHLHLPGSMQHPPSLISSHNDLGVFSGPTPPSAIPVKLEKEVDLQCNIPPSPLGGIIPVGAN